MNQAPPTVEVPLDRDVDGDTVRVMIKNKSVSVRFLGIDTQETHFQGQSQGFWADKASALMTHLIKNEKKVTLEFENARCDRYGRILAYVRVGKRMLNDLMLEQGLAVNYCIAPHLRYCGQFAKRVEKAAHDRDGMYADPKMEIPYVWRRKISNKPMDKLVGSIRTFQVYPPKEYMRIPLWDRVFFMDAADIKPPFQLARQNQR